MGELSPQVKSERYTFGQSDNVSVDTGKEEPCSFTQPKNKYRITDTVDEKLKFSIFLKEKEFGTDKVTTTLGLFPLRGPPHDLTE